jgi:replicative DNA helicase
VPQSRDEVERAVISLIEFYEDIAKLRAINVSPKSFIVYPKIYEFILNYTKQYEGKIPPREVILTEFPEFEFIDVPQDSKDYYFSTLQELNYQSSVVNVFEFATDFIEKGQVKEAVNYTTKALSKLNKPIKVSQEKTDKESLNRFEEYKEKRALINQGTRIGVKTGLFLFDDQLMGWQPGWLVGLVGRYEVGKSWLLVYTCCNAYDDGYRILYISPEMVRSELALRFDVTLARLWGYEFSHTCLSYGQRVNEAKYREFLEKVSQNDRWLTADSNDGKVFTVEGIADIADNFKPDIIAIDGLPLLTEVGQESDQSWQKIFNLSTGLKNLAVTTNSTILCVMQANRDAAGRTDSMPRKQDISYGDAFGQACDILIMMGSDAKDESIRKLKLEKKRGGRADRKTYNISFNVDTGDIGRRITK